MENAKVIQWFPGHMAKARREITESLNKVDLVFELYDARIPYSSKNPMVDEIVKNKPRVVLLNKAGVADSNITKLWIDYYRNKGILALDIDSISGFNISKIENYANRALKETFEKREKRGIKSKQVKALIIGIPNVGKSTLINKLCGKKSAKVANLPGVTKNLTWMKTKYKMVVLDTPGILWPKFDSEQLALNLASISAISENVLSLLDVSTYILKFLSKYYPNILLDRFKIKEYNDESYNVISKNINAIKNNEVDYKRVSTYIINEIKSERIKGITFDRKGVSNE